MRTFKAWLLQPTEVLPLELYRIFTGSLSLVYFIQVWMELPDYGITNSGFLDHELVRRIFWFTGISLFQPGFADWLFRLYLIAGLLGSLMLLTGIRARLGAFIAWIVAVSYFRFIFPVVNLNDSSVQLCLLWSMFFPVGQCLRLDRRAPLRDQLEVKTPQLIVLMFLLHFTLAYEVAGLSKLTNAYWRQGLALYFILRLPLAQSHAFWRLSHLPLLKFCNYASLVIEPLIPIGFWLGRRNRLKYLFLACALGLHGGIILTIGVVYANLSWIAVQLIVFRHELVALLRRRAGAAGDEQALVRSPWGVRAAAVFIVVVGLSMTEGIPGLGDTYAVGFFAQWSVGLAQEYHLFDWIDKFNYVVENRVALQPSGQQGGRMVVIPASRFFPDTLRGFLVQSYLHDMRWMRVPRGQVGELRRSLLEHAARRFAASCDQDGEVIVETTDQRAAPDNMALNNVRYRVLIRFRVQNRQAVLEEPY